MKTTHKLAAIVLAGLSSTAGAGVYTDDLSKCLVESTTQEDKIALVRWIFVAISQHPVVSPLTNIKESDIEASNSQVGQLFTSLLTDRCAETAKKAVKYEGVAAIQQSFQVLGQVASVEMFSDPGVGKVMAGLVNYTDQAKLAELGK